MATENRPTSASDAARNSLLRQEPKQRLLKEVVKAKTGTDLREAIREAGRQVSAGKSLYLTELERPAEKTRA